MSYILVSMAVIYYSRQQTNQKRGIAMGIFFIISLPSAVFIFGHLLEMILYTINPEKIVQTAASSFRGSAIGLLIMVTTIAGEKSAADRYITRKREDLEPKLFSFVSTFVISSIAYVVWKPTLLTLLGIGFILFAEILFDIYVIGLGGEIEI